MEGQSATTALLPAEVQCSGVVVDNTGMPLIGATVRVVETNEGAITDIDGKFVIPNVRIGATIEISYIGYSSKRVKFEGESLKITMEEDGAVLNEVVVIGYDVTQKRAKVTNSISKVSEETLTIGANANPAQALAGAVTGVKVNITSGSPSATPSITIRGGSNYDGGSNEPLVIVDGVIRNSLSDINPNDIESMDVLKDAGATALYGARAGNGVILITTKKGKTGTARVDFNLKVGLNYYDNDYNMCTDEDYLYYYRLGLQNCQWTLPDDVYASSYNNQLFGTNQPGGIGRTELSDTQSCNILRKTDDNAYLLQKGWKEMLDPVSDNTILYKNIDPLKVNGRTPYVTQDYSANISGGNDRGSYYAGLGYYDADGLIKGTYYKRYSFALTGSYKISKWLEPNSVFNYTRVNWLNDDPTLSTTYFLNRGLGYKFVRYETEDGTPLYGTSNPTVNVNANKGNFDRDYQSDKFSMTQSLTATLMPGLTLKGSMSWFYNEELKEEFNHDYYTSNEGALNPTGTSGVNRTYKSTASFLRYFDQTYNVVANFNRTFADKHTVNVMAGSELYKRRYRGFSASGTGAPTGDFADLGLTQNDAKVQSRVIDSEHSREALLSYFGRLKYDYMDKYLIAATFRSDGYSRLVDNKWGSFPGVSAGWVFSKEGFWEKLGLDWINYGKIRSSYGMNATINSKYLGYYTLQGAYSLYRYNSSAGYRISALPNPSLNWEKTRTAEVGLDLGFLNNRFNLGLTYYNRLTMDKYQPLSLPQTTGFSSVMNNNGSYRNQGLEVDLNATLLRIRDFSWTLNANISYNKNTVVKLPDNKLPNNRQGGTEVYTGNGKETHYVGGIQEGQSPNDFVGYGVVKMLRSQSEIDALGDYIDIGGSYGVGIYANEAGRQRLITLGYTNNVQLMPGDFLYEDRNGDNMVESKDQKVLGNKTPKWMGGFNTTFKWKGFQLYARFDMGFGFQVYDSNIAFWLGEGQGAMAFNDDVRDTWTPDNPGAKYPRMVFASQYGTDNYIRTNSFFTQSGNYLACRELQLSYTLPENICKKFWRQGLTVSVTGQNLGYIKSCTIPLPDNVTYTSGNTAGNGGTYNVPRTLLFGLNISF
ncbi:MAG: SusC/RagA family TonB-linked outer membrane protein [Bacteroides sp.]|nr:SusC/RagA family TonB-linked outer membrane protein [Bacteroides sp.]